MTGFSDRPIIASVLRRAHLEPPVEREPARSETASVFDAVFESGLVPMLLVGDDLVCADANSAACRLLGIGREEAVGRPLASFWPPELRGRFGDDWRELVERGSRECRLVRADGIRCDAELSARRDVLPGLHLVALHDVSERRRAQDSLADRERLLQTIIDTEPDCVELIGPDGTVLEMNRPGLALLGARNAEQVVGRLAWGRAAPEHRDAFRISIERVFAGGPSELDFEVADLHGGRRWVHMHAVPLRHGNEIVAALAISRDITDRKRLEEQVRLAQRMETVGRLAGGVAHEFNNLLTAIGGSCELLLARLEEDDPRRADAEHIRKASDRAASLTRQLLAFGRRQILQPEVLDPEALVGGLEPALHDLLGEDVELVVRAGPDLGRVRADPSELERVVVDLAGNARDAMPDGGRLTIELSNLVLRESDPGPVPPGSYVVLALVDTGVGMDEQMRAHLFDPFYTTKDVGEGTGLGLATTYGIVKQSGGYIYVESEPGHGATFRIYLPRVAPHAAGRPILRVVRETEAAKTVLLVEDEAIVRDIVREVLETNGYDVLVAASGPEALELAAAHPSAIDLVITDVVMPRMSGRELAERLAHARPETRVLFTSGYPDGALEAASDFLQKPFTHEMLMRKVREVLESAAA